MILCGARLLLRLGLRTDRRCARFPFGLFRRASSRRRIFGRMRHTALLLALLRGDGARLLPVLRFALRRERLTTGLLLLRAVHLRLLCLLRHRRMRLGPRGFVTTLGGGLLSRYRTACAVLPEAVRIGTGSLRRTRHAVVRLRTFIGHLTRSAWRTRRTRSAGPSLLGRTVRRLSTVRRIRTAGKRTYAVRCGFTRSRRSTRGHPRRIRLHDPDVLHGRRSGRTVCLRASKVRRHRSAHDRRAGARHLAAALRETLRERVVIRGRHGRAACGHHRACRHSRGRPVVGIAQAGAEALTYRRNARAARVDLRVAPLRRIDLLREPASRLTMHERGRRHGRDAARRTVVDVGVMNVIDVRHVIDIRDVHVVVVVHAVVVAGTPATPTRMPRFTRAQREPGDARRGHAADGQTHAPVERATAPAAADEGDQRRRINRRRVDDDRTGHPPP